MQCPELDANLKPVCPAVSRSCEAMRQHIMTESSTRILLSNTSSFIAAEAASKLVPNVFIILLKLNAGREKDTCLIEKYRLKIGKRSATYVA